MFVKMFVIYILSVQLYSASSLFTYLHTVTTLKLNLALNIEFFKQHFKYACNQNEVYKKIKNNKSLHTQR